MFATVLTPISAAPNGVGHVRKKRNAPVGDISISPFTWMSRPGNVHESWRTRQSLRRHAGKKEGGSLVRGTQESDRVASLASAETEVRAGAVLPGGRCPEPQATSPLPQPTDNTHDGSGLLAGVRRKTSAAAIIAAGKTFRSRTFSTPTPDFAIYAKPNSDSPASYLGALQSSHQ